VSQAITSRVSLFDKLWRQHVVYERDDGHTLLYIDRHYVGDDLPRDTFDVLARKGIRVRQPGATYAMADHYAPTHGRSIAEVVDADRRELVQKLVDFTREQHVPMFPLDDPRHGIVHVTGPEQGLTLPGMTVVCGDSHTSTHGAFGAFAFGIGASEVSHVLATQTLWQKRPATLDAHIDGSLAAGITAKDLVLALIAHLGAAGAAGHVIEYRGAAVDALSMEARMTLCNMSIEAGARAGMIAPDNTTFAYLRDRPYAPTGAAWEEVGPAIASVRALDRIAVWNVNADAARRCAARWRDGGLPAEAVMDLESAVRNADIVSCATLATEPLIHAEWLAEGSHLDLIGSFTPQMVEAAPECFQQGDVWVDTPEALLKAGDLLKAIAVGRWRAEAVKGDLTALCRNECPRRTSDTQRTVFKAVGSALEDLAAARLAYRALAG
jgi:3-isopropylmalate dehydratase large subunit